MDSLFDRFVALSPATSPGVFDAIRLSDTRSDFLGKTSEGAPIVLLHDASKPRYRAGFQLKFLKAEFHTTCLVHSDKGEADGQFAIISCDPVATDLHEMFIRSVSASVSDLSVGSETDELQSRFQKLADLFRQFSRPGGRELTGLWAELFVIERSRDVAGALRAWRSTSTERFDFSWSTGQLEVKATTKAIRSHEFGLEQLQDSENRRSFVASFLLQPLNGGKGAMDLAASIESRIYGENKLREKLWQNIAGDLGADFSDAVDKQFDIAYAARNGVLFASSDIPAPHFEDDPRITSVRFVSDLSSVLPTATGISLETLLHSEAL